MSGTDGEPPRRRGVRRAVRPATGGVPQTGGRPERADDDTARPDERGPRDDERWWREQRPPHWE